MIDPYIVKLLVIGLLLLAVTLGSGWISRLPLSYALIYLIVGVALGSYGFQLIKLRPDANFFERLTELVVIVSVFGCGLHINRPLNIRAWQTTIRLIGLLMPFTIAALAAIAHWLLGMGWGEAILLGAILAPTDPVLASEVQLANVEDKNELRFGLTSEGGLNDALAFPFVYFGIEAYKNPNWDHWFKDWVLIDLLWAIAAGLVMGIVVAKAVVWCDEKLQKRRQAEAVMEDFVAISTILLTYSLTEVVNGYGFLAVFVAGVVVQRYYYDDQEKRMAQLEFTEQLEKLLEVAAVVLLGTILLFDPIVKYAGQSIAIACWLLLVIRPLGVWLLNLDGYLPRPTQVLIGWFGIRGLGSIYYLAYALGKGIGGETGEQIAWITFSVVIISIVVHGTSALPLMKWYEAKRQKQKQAT